jgi:hypothetical protein
VPLRCRGDRGHAVKGGRRDEQAEEVERCGDGLIGKAAFGEQAPDPLRDGSGVGSCRDRGECSLANTVRRSSLGAEIVTQQMAAYRWRWRALSVVLLAEAMDILDTTTMNVAGPSVRRSIGGGDRSGPVAVGRLHHGLRGPAHHRWPSR